MFEIESGKETRRFTGHAGLVSALATGPHVPKPHGLVRAGGGFQRFEKVEAGADAHLACFGNVLAVASIIPLQSGIDISAVAKGMEMMGTSSMLYPALKIEDMVLANVIVIILGLLTSILPAWRAASYDPIKALNTN